MPAHRVKSQTTSAFPGPVIVTSVALKEMLGYLTVSNHFSYRCLALREREIQVPRPVSARNRGGYHRDAATTSASSVSMVASTERPKRSSRAVGWLGARTIFM